MKSFIYLVSLFFLILPERYWADLPKKYSIEQFIKNQNDKSPSLSWDSKRLLFSSDRSGIFNVWVLDLATKEAKPLTHSKKESFFAVSYFPDDRRILFENDEEGDECLHLFLLEEDGTIKDLTPWKGSRNQFRGWSRDRKSFFFESNKRDPKYFDLFEMDVASLEAKLLFQNEKGFLFGALSPNKECLALVQIINADNGNIYLLDLKTEKLKLMTPHEGSIAYHPQTFSLDSKTLYYLTDEGDDFIYLKKYDLPKEDSEIVNKCPWDIEKICLSYNEKWRAIQLNQEGKTEIKLLHHQTNRPFSLPIFSDGNITSLSFSKDESKIVFSLNGSTIPGDLYTLDLKTGTLEQLTKSLNPEIDPTDLVSAQVVSYLSFDGLEIPAIYYEPHLAKQGKKVPALIWVHGGPGGQSKIGFDSLIQYLVNHDIAILAVNNRGSSGYGKSFYRAADRKHGEVDLDDCVFGKNFLRGTGNIDMERVGIIGGSYGGYMTLAALSFRPDQFKLGVDIFGVSNWLRTLLSIPAWWENERESLYKKIGHPEKDKDYLISISPLFHAKNITKPLMVIQGKNDPRVLKAESDEIVEAVKENGVPVHYLLLEDEGHGFAKKENRAFISSQILSFLEKFL